MKFKSYLRFSLRTFLLVITVFAMWLGLVVSRAQKQKTAVNAITKIGGSVYYDYQLLKVGTKLTVPGGTITIGDERKSYLFGQLTASSPVPKWLSERIGDEMFVKIIAVHLRNTGLSDDRMHCLAGLPDIRVLDLSHNPITDKALTHLAGMRRLETLRLDGTSIEGPGLAYLQHLPRLDDLILADTRITDEGLKHLSAPDSLVGVALDNTSVSDAGLEYLHSASQLKVVSLCGTHVHGPGLRHLNGSQIEVLRLAHTQIDEHGLAMLAKWPKLRELFLEHSSLTDTGVEQLKQLTHLETLRLPWVAHRSSNISVEAARGIEKALPNTKVIYPP